MKMEMQSSGELFNLPPDFIKELSARTVARVSGEYSRYLKEQRFDELFNNQTGETKGSIGTYRAEGKNPGYVVKAGIGIKGSLNYLAGLYRGEAVSGSGKRRIGAKAFMFQGGKRFLYAGGKRDLLRGNGKTFLTEPVIMKNYKAILDKMVKDLS